LVYLNSFIREQPKKYESFWFYLSDNLQEKPELREYASNVELRETVKNQRLFDIARWEHTRHLMTEEDIHINGKRIAMTEREMIDVLKNELDSMMLMTHESRLMLMNDIRQSLKCKSCYEDFTNRFLLNHHPIHLDNYPLPCFRCSFQTSRFIILNRRALLIDHKDNNNDGNGDCRESTISPPITSSSSNNPRAESAVAADDAEDSAEDAVGAAENAFAAEDGAESAVAADDADDAAVGAAENAVAFEDGAESAVAVDDADDQKDNNDGDCLEPTNNPRKRKVNLSEYDDDEDVNVLRLNVSSRAVRNEH